MATMISTKFDAFNSLSILNQNRIATHKEAQRSTTTRLDINDAISNISAYTLEESLRIRTRILGQASENIQNDTALLKTAQGSGDSIVDSIKEIQKLAISATDESLTDDDRLIIQKDINRLVNQISESAQVTFNGRNLIDGSAMTGNQAIATVLSNNSLYSGTTASTALTALQNSDGANLGINASDRITASYVKGGNIYTTSFSVGNSKLEDIFINLNKINGVTTDENGKATALTDAAFVGGGRGILTNPAENEPFKPETIRPDTPDVARPNKVIAEPKVVAEPTLEERVDAPFVPSEFVVPESELVEPIQPTIEEPNELEFENVEEYNAAMADYESAMANYATQREQYEFNKTAFDAVKAGAEIIYKPTTLNDDATAEQQAQYESELAAYNDAVVNYSTQAAKDYIQYREKQAAYDKYLEDKATYDKYVSDKAKWDEFDANYKIYEDYKKKYDEELYPQYQKDLEYYNMMAVDVVQNDSNGLSVTAQKPGLAEQISGISINVTDSSGKVKSFANAALNNFKTTTFASDDVEDNSINFQIGETVGQTMNFGFDDMRSEAFGLKGANGNIISISTKEDADAALATIENALSRATKQIQTIGSSEKKLGYIADNLAMEISSIQEPDSLVRNAGMAKTFTMYALDIFNRNRTQSMFAMANQHSSSVLALLR